MSPHVVHDDAGEGFAWATLAIVLLVILGVAVASYFAWWAPSREPVIVQQPQPAPPAPTMPGPPGPPGPQGEPGPQGSPGPANPGQGGAGPSDSGAER